MERTDLCDHDCNNCQLIGNKMVYSVLQSIFQKNESMERIIQLHCPNLTCCPVCGVDDFGHVEGCEMIQNWRVSE